MSSVKILLDIGAGDKKFVKDYRRYNAGHSLMYLCGERGFKDPINKEEILVNPKKGKILKVCASYKDFNLPDLSLDVACINAFHLFRPPHGISEELVRCVRRGGVVFSAHPIGVHPALPEEFFSEVLFSSESNKEISETRIGFRRYSWGRTEVRLTIGGGQVIVYPASPDIKSRLSHGIYVQNDVNYIYSGMRQRPSLRVWVKV